MQTHTIPTLGTAAGARNAWLITTAAALPVDQLRPTAALYRGLANELEATGELDAADLLRILAGILTALDFDHPNTRKG